MFYCDHAKRFRLISANRMGEGHVPLSHSPDHSEPDLIPVRGSMLYDLPSISHTFLYLNHKAYK